MFAECGIGYSQDVDKEVPSHADGGPAEQVQHAAVPAGSGGAAADQSYPPAGYGEPDSWAGGEGHLSAVPTPDGEAEEEPDYPPGWPTDPQAGAADPISDTAELPGGPIEPIDPADQRRTWRSMFRPQGTRQSSQEPPDLQQADPRPTGVQPTDPQPTDRQPADPRPAGSQPAGSQPTDPRSTGVQLTKRPLARLSRSELVGRPLVSPRLTADPRWRIWAARIAIAVVIYLIFMLLLGWRVGLTVAAAFMAVDILFRSKTTAAVPAAIRVTAAQGSTRRRLRLLRSAGYLALNGCTIPGRKPGTRSVIDHLVIGPAGIFALDSERWDRRLPIRTIGGDLYHGPLNQEKRLKHARWEAHQTAKLLGAELGHPVRVRPVMVLYGPSIPWAVTRLQGVDVFDGGRVGTYFRRQSKATAGHHLDASQIAVMYAAAERALPPVQ